jgi:ABC1 atypical kinase-like domain
VTALPPALRALAQAATSLARGSASARLALARLDGLVDPAALPPEVRGAVAKAIGRAAEQTPAPLGAGEAERVLRAAWGRPPRRVLEALELDHPLSAGPLGQVHAARLGGDPVTVELRRPGLERAIRGDLALLDGVASPLRAAFPRLDTTAWLRAVREQVLDELDLEHAAGQQRRVGRALRDLDDVVVPEVHADLAAPGVLVAARLEGPTLAEDRPADRGAAARTLVLAHATAARAGIAPVDARPDHVVLLGGPRLGLLGTGAAVAVDRGRVESWLAALAAVRDGDAETLGRVGDGLGALGTEDAEAALALTREVLDGLMPDPPAPARLDAEALAGVGERALDALPALFALARRATPAPEDGPLARMLGQLALVLARLAASEDWARLPTPARGSAGRRSPRSGPGP